MDPERRKALQKTQKKCIAAQVVMCAAYISAGILLAVTGRHCVADTPIYDAEFYLAGFECGRYFICI